MGGEIHRREEINDRKSYMERFTHVGSVTARENHHALVYEYEKNPCRENSSMMQQRMFHDALSFLSMGSDK